MRRKRRNHTPGFKARVALEALKGEKTLSELSQQYDLHPNQIQQWRKKLLEGATDVFGAGEKEHQAIEEEVKELHAKIGKLTMERDFLSKALGR